MTTASSSNREENVELPGWEPEDWVKPGKCLAKICELEGHKREDTCEKTLTTNDIVWQYCDEDENGNGTDRRLPRRK